MLGVVLVVHRADVQNVALLGWRSMISMGHWRCMLLPVCCLQLVPLCLECVGTAYDDVACGLWPVLRCQ